MFLGHGSMPLCEVPGNQSGRLQGVLPRGKTAPPKRRPGLWSIAYSSASTGKLNMPAPTGLEGDLRYRPPLLSTVAVSMSRLTRIRHSCHEARPPRERWPFSNRQSTWRACPGRGCVCRTQSLPAGGARSPPSSAAAHRSRATASRLASMDSLRGRCPQKQHLCKPPK